MKFVTMFPLARNIELIKDVGMIPFIMHKEYGFDSIVVCYNNSEYKYLEHEVKGLKVEFIKKLTGNSIVDGIMYLIKNAKKIDVLNTYHLKFESMLFFLVYKILNSKGKFYLKLDCGIASPSFKRKGLKNSIRNKCKIAFLKKCDLISIETTKGYEQYKSFKLPLKLEYVPNGCYYVSNKLCSKENIICSVGRIGTYQKATDILMEAFKIASPSISNWKLNIIGPIEDEFKKYINNYFIQNPQLKTNVTFLGELDKEHIFKEYQKSKIFCLTSRFESFGLVLTEALSQGCFIIMSNVDSAKDITNDNSIGKVFNIDDTQELANLLVKYCNDNEYLNSMELVSRKHYEKNFNWINICKKIVKALNLTI